jgi:hypothetical protein
VHGRNFVARSLAVNRHGAILGMQNAVQQNQPSFRGDAQHRTRNLEVPGSLRAPERQRPPVNAFLTINRAKIAE